MPRFRAYVTYSLPEYLDGEADNDDKAIDIVSGELIDLDQVEFEIQELEEDEGWEGE